MSRHFLIAAISAAVRHAERALATAAADQLSDELLQSIARGIQHLQHALWMLQPGEARRRA